MKKTFIYTSCILICICLNILLVSPLLFTHAQEKSTSATDFESRLLMAEAQIMIFEYNPKSKEAINAPEQLVNLYYEAAQDPELTKIVCKHILNTYHSMHGSTKSAAQVSQISDEAQVKFNLLQAMQNIYIIKFLKEKQ